MTTENEVLIEQAKPEPSSEGSVLPDVSMEKQLAEAREGIKKSDAETEQFVQARKDYLDTLEKSRDSMAPPGAVDFTKIPRPEFEMNKRFIIAGAVLTLASVVGAAYMKTGSLGMMSAMTGAINGLMAGKKERYQMEMNRYNEIRENIIEKHKQEVAEYNAIRTQKDKSIQEVVQEIRLAYLKHGNDLKHFDGTINGITRMLDAKSKMILKFENQTNLAGLTKKTPSEIDYLFDLAQFREQHPGLSQQEAVKQFGTREQWHIRIYGATHKGGKAGAHFGGSAPKGPIFSKAFEDAKKKNPDAKDEEIIDALKKKGFDETK